LILLQPGQNTKRLANFANYCYNNAGLEELL
jgi:hypothetical protein